MALQLRYPNLIVLGGTNLTDESRSYAEDRDERGVEVELADGTIKKYIKSVKRTFDISWENVHKSAAGTVDGFGGRDEIRALGMSGDALTLSVRDGVTISNYTVFVDNYDEEIIIRRGADSRYQVSLSLKEQ